MVSENFELRQRGELSFVVCPPLERAGFLNAISTRHGGISPLPDGSLSLGNFTREQANDQREFVLENRRRFKSAIGANNWTLVLCRQIHSADIRTVQDETDALSDPQPCDALTARMPKTLLGILTADCLPVIIVDERTCAVANVHAGWRGTLAGIVAQTVERMQREYDSRPADLSAALGPAICAKCFEVGPEVLRDFREKYDYADDLIFAEQKTGKGHININQANIRQLLSCGLTPERIYDSALCTVCQNNLFFSHRAERGHERHVGRLLSVVGTS